MRVYQRMLSGQASYVAVRPMHGLANRLRAYCSAAAYARQTKRELLVVWEPDIHSHTRFTELFEPADGVAILSSARAGLFPAELWKWYNHMQPDKARKRNPVAADSSDADGRSLYVTTAYKLETEPPLDGALYSDCLRSLQPVAAVRAMLLPREPPNGLSTLIGVHVRMMVNQSLDVPGIDADARTDSNLRMMNEAVVYREACHFAYFVASMRAVLKAQPSARFYLAADSDEAYDGVMSSFEPGVVRTLSSPVMRECGAANEGAALRGPTKGLAAGRRALACQQAALADLLNLASTKQLLLSHCARTQRGHTFGALPTC